MAPLEQTGDGIDQDTKGRLAQLMAGLAKRQRPLHPPVACVIGIMASEDKDKMAPRMTERTLGKRTLKAYVET